MVRKRGSTLRVSKPMFGFLLTLPALTILAFVIFYPLIQAFITGFRHVTFFNINTETPFVGFQNYLAIVHSKKFLKVFLNTGVFVIGSLIGQLSLGLGLALLLNHISRGRNFLRGIFLLPWIIPTVVTALLWMFMFNPQTGIVNYIASKLHLISEYIPWLTNFSLAMPTLITASVWKLFPFYMIVMLAGLQTISQSVTEAAVIDGAGRFQLFVYITLPLLKPILTVAVLTSIIFNSKFFPLIWVLTAGGPGYATTTFIIDVYRTGFELLNLGQAAALGSIFLVILIGICLAILFLSKVNLFSSRKVI